MKHERIYFDPSDDRVYLDTYCIVDPLMSKRDAMLVIPGGGYNHVCADREGECVALTFNAKEMNAFVLTYSIGEDAVYPRQLLDAARAMLYIKTHADEYNVDPSRIFGVGFSAGGHLLGTLTTLHGVAEELLGLEKDYLKLSGSIFSYAVISAYLGNTHGGTYNNLLKKPLAEYTEEEKDLLSIDHNVDENTPPAFIWHTSQDPAVPVEGSMKLAMAYVNAGVPVALHVFPYGPHGIALGKEFSSHGHPGAVQPLAEVWVDLACKWIRTLPKN